MRIDFWEGHSSFTKSDLSDEHFGNTNSKMKTTTMQVLVTCSLFCVFETVSKVHDLGKRAIITLSTGWQDDPSQKLLQGDHLPQNEEGLRWVNPGAHAGAGQPASSWVTAPSHCPQIPCWAPCWAIIVKILCSSCQRQRLSTDFRNASWNRID